MPQADKNINFDDLFRYNYRPLCLYALHYLQDVDLAEDIVQESYAALWEKLQEGAHVLNRKSYLYMMVRNRCLDHLRKKGIPTESLKPYDTYGIIDDDDAQERSQTEARLWTAIDSLPEKCREVFIMLFITNSRSLLKLMSIESVMSSNHLILFSSSSPAFNLSQPQGLFQ